MKENSIFYYFGIQTTKMNERNLLYNVIKKFTSDEVDLSPANIDNMQMCYVFKKLIRIGARQSNEEAGEHFIPREVIIEPECIFEKDGFLKDKLDYMFTKITGSAEVGK